MIPEYIHRAFPCFDGKEMQLIFAIAVHLDNDGNCYTSLSKLAEYASIRRRTAGEIVKRLEELGVFVVRRPQGKNAIICFGSRENIENKCKYKSDDKKKEHKEKLKIAKISKNYPDRCSAPLPINDTPAGQRSGSLLRDLDIYSNNSNTTYEEEDRKSQTQKTSTPLPHVCKHTRKIEQWVRKVFDTYSEYPWAIQKNWKDKYIDEDLGKRCLRLIENDCIEEYLIWANVYLDEIEQKKGSKYNRYFKTILSWTWFNEFFEKKLDSNMENDV